MSGAKSKFLTPCRTFGLKRKSNSSPRCPSLSPTALPLLHGDVSTGRGDSSLPEVLHPSSHFTINAKANLKTPSPKNLNHNTSKRKSCVATEAHNSSSKKGRVSNNYQEPTKTSDKSFAEGEPELTPLKGTDLKSDINLKVSGEASSNNIKIRKAKLSLKLSDSKESEGNANNNLYENAEVIGEGGSEYCDQASVNEQSPLSGIIIPEGIDPNIFMTKVPRVSLKRHSLKSLQSGSRSANFSKEKAAGHNGKIRNECTLLLPQESAIVTRYLADHPLIQKESDPKESKVLSGNAASGDVAYTPQEITDNMLRDLISSTNDKISTLEQLKRNQLYCKKHDLKKLEESTARWKCGARRGLELLLEEMKSKAGDSGYGYLQNLLRDREVPLDTIGFHIETMEFID